MWWLDGRMVTLWRATQEDPGSRPRFFRDTGPGPVIPVLHHQAPLHGYECSSWLELPRPLSNLPDWKGGVEYTKKKKKNLQMYRMSSIYKHIIFCKFKT